MLACLDTTWTPLALRASCATLLAALLFAPAARAADDPYGARVVVSRVIVEARVLDSASAPILGLGPDDFEIYVDGLPAAATTVEWIVDAETAGAPAPASPAPSRPAEPVLPEATPGTAPRAGMTAGRLVVLFFERKLEKNREEGLLRSVGLAERMIDDAGPRDRIAIVTYDSQLALQIDFTNDREALRRVLHTAVVSRHRPPDAPVQPPPALGRAFDFHAARLATTPEQGLLVVGRALAQLDGPKSLFFFASELGRLTGDGVVIGPEFSLASFWLQRSGTAVYTFDLVNADTHSLEGALREMSERTGGLYTKTNEFAVAGLERAQRAISGHYVLVVTKPEGLHHGTHALEVKLKKGRTGRVLARTSFAD